MSAQTEHIDMRERDVVAVKCIDCGWDNDGELVLVDRYLTDYPPIPRHKPEAFLEVYRDDGGDPDDRNPTCDGCGLDLEPDTVVEDVDRTRAELIEHIRSSGTAGEKVWLPILRLAHWWATR